MKPSTIADVVKCHGVAFRDPVVAAAFAAAMDRICTVTGAEVDQATPARFTPPETAAPALHLDAAAVARLGELMRDACDVLRADPRADPLPVARLLAECARVLDLPCPWCGGSGETGAYVGLGPGPRPDDVPERCPACCGGQP